MPRRPSHPAPLPSAVMLGAMLAALVASPFLPRHAAARTAAAPLAARDYLASIRPSPDLQAFLDRTIEELAARDSAITRVKLRIALLDLGAARGDADGHGPRLAERNGYAPVYPASVVKFVYLMAAHAWQEQGKLEIDPTLDALLTEMVIHSSNRATQQVFARLTGTEPGPALAAATYRDFSARRQVVKRWLETLGIDDLHCVHPTYDGNGDLFGRDVQFLRDKTVPGGLVSSGFANRQAMTAVGTAKLLALLATDRALSPASSAAARQRMRRDPARQPYLRHRIAGGTARLPGLEAYTKTGTWGPIFADAGIVRDPRGHQMVLVVFTDGTPPYRGDFIAELAHRCAAHVLSRPSSPASAR